MPSAAGAQNLYERVRATFFLAAIYRYHLPAKLPPPASGCPGGALVPFEGYTRLLGRRFEEAVDEFRAVEERLGPSDAIASAWPPLTRPWGSKPWRTRSAAASARSAAISGCFAWAIQPTIPWRSARP